MEIVPIVNGHESNTCLPIGGLTSSGKSLTNICLSLWPFPRESRWQGTSRTWDGMPKVMGSSGTELVLKMVESRMMETSG